MNFEDAKLACTKLGEGWRLPTRNELNYLYKNQKEIGGFDEKVYYGFEGKDTPIVLYFSSGEIENNWSNKYNVRAVKSF
jgi:hypothetical protein